MDITPNAEQTPPLENVQFQQFLDAIPDLVLVKGPQSRIIWANKAFQTLYGMDAEKLKGMIDASFSSPDYTQKFIQDDLQVFTTGKVLDIPEEPVTRFDGQVRLFHTIKSPIFNAQGKVIMTVGISSDITERKKAEQELIKHTKEVERLNALMIGRELKMVELKKENDELKKKG